MEKKKESTMVHWGDIGIMEKKKDTTVVYWGSIGRTEKKMETAIVYWGNKGIVEKKWTTTIVGYVEVIILNPKTLNLNPYIGMHWKRGFANRVPCDSKT